MWKIKKGKDKKIMGRPTKFDDECIRKLQEMFMNDSTVQEACLFAWVSTVQYYEHLKVDEEFANKMKQAQLYAFILAKKTLIKSLKSSNESIRQKWAVEFLKRRDRRYSDKVDSSVELEWNMNVDMNLWDMSMLELDELRKNLLKWNK